MHLVRAMSDSTSTPKGLPLAERRARLAKMVERGEITPVEAARVDLREPCAEALAYAARVAEKVKGRRFSGNGAKV